MTCDCTIEKQNMNDLEEEYGSILESEKALATFPNIGMNNHKGESWKVWDSVINCLISNTLVKYSQSQLKSEINSSVLWLSNWIFSGRYFA